MSELPSTGLFFTWFNQRAIDPITIKMDRNLVISSWLDLFPASYYRVEDPNYSDHSPLVLLPGSTLKPKARFQFKNYLVNSRSLWGSLISVFATRHHGSPISVLYSKLRDLKSFIKLKNWSNSSYISNSIKEVQDLQHNCISQLQVRPLDPHLNHAMLNINSSLVSLQKSWSM